MPEQKSFPVYDDNGYIGTLLSPARFLDARSEKTIQLENGQEISVPSAALKVQPDGSFHLLRSAPAASEPDVTRRIAPASQDATPDGEMPRTDAFAARAESSPPVIDAARDLEPAGAAVPGAGPGFFTVPHGAVFAVQRGTFSTAAAGTFFEEDYEIERVQIGRIIDAPVGQRQEGETFILPVVEEVLVYQKKLYLREEIRITRRKKPVEEVRRIEEDATRAAKE